VFICIVGVSTKGTCTRVSSKYVCLLTCFPLQRVHAQGIYMQHSVQKINSMGNVAFVEVAEAEEEAEKEEGVSGI
jgi:hypothetical protein